MCPQLFQRNDANKFSNLFPIFIIEMANLFIYCILYKRVANYSNKIMLTNLVIYFQFLFL